MSSSFPVEDCRDYLRTGRCKYGMSCKYNHPANVQNGGGIKPSDPSELLFPLRPNEPVCDYYMKHRTCKFGSACKFNHPMHLPPGSSSFGRSTSNGMATTGSSSSHSNHHNSSRRSEPVQLLLSPVGTEVNGQVMMMQYLPQRPGEPDCIYFLKNRSCKYGATCRYHHPVFNTRRQQESPRSSSSNKRHDGYNNIGNQQQQRVQYVMPNYNSQGQRQSQVPISVITVDGNNAPTQGFLVSGDTYCVPAGSVGFTEQSSSASSVGSSLETSNGEFLSDSSRIRRNTSVGSFNSEARYHMSHSASDGNIVAARRTRASSFGEMPSNGGTWSQRARMTSIGRQDPQYHSYAAGGPHRRSTSGSGRHARMNGGPHDEGFTRMTSALLSMLDTPEEAASESGEEDSPNKGPRPPQTHDASDMLARLHLTPPDPDVPQEIIRQTELYDERGQNKGFLRSFNGGVAQPELQNDGPATSWSPLAWTSGVTSQPPPPQEEQGDFLSSMFHTNQSGPSSNQPPNGADIGMYLH